MNEQRKVSLERKRESQYKERSGKAKSFREMERTYDLQELLPRSQKRHLRLPLSSLSALCELFPTCPLTVVVSCSC